MAGKAIWKGYINFRDLNLPVRLHTAVREEQIRFHLLHRTDHVKLHQQMVCAYDKLPVPPDSQVKGFEVEEGRYIIVDPEELEKATPESSRMIEVHEFVKTGQIDPVYLERAYYLSPDSSPDIYNTLAAALDEMDVSGICTWTMRKRTYLGAIQSTGNMLRINTLRHADEVILAGSLELEDFPVSEKELRIASDLIEQLSAPFNPQKFENEHRKKLQELINRKARGGKIAVLKPKQLKPTSPDKLLKALEDSLRRVA